MALAKAVLAVVLEIPISWPASSRYSPLEKLWRMRRCFWRAGDAIGVSIGSVLVAWCSLLMREFVA